MLLNFAEPETTRPSTGSHADSLRLQYHVGLAEIVASEYRSSNPFTEKQHTQKQARKKSKCTTTHTHTSTTTHIQTDNIQAINQSNNQSNKRTNKHRQPLTHTKPKSNTEGVRPCKTLCIIGVYLYTQVLRSHVCICMHMCICRNLGRWIDIDTDAVL